MARNMLTADQIAEAFPRLSDYIRAHKYVILACRPSQGSPYRVPVTDKMLEDLEDQKREGDNPSLLEVECLGIDRDGDWVGEVDGFFGYSGDPLLQLVAFTCREAWEDLTASGDWD